MPGNFKLSHDNLRSEVAFVGILLVLLGIFLYSDFAGMITTILRPLMMILGGILVLSAAFANDDDDHQ